MISNAHVHNQTSVVSLTTSNETPFKGQQVENFTKQKEETLDQYLTASEMNSLKLEILSQRGHIKGYRGL
ncbi:hypothetical protein OCK74_21665 [Chitinophagaceae bacterium LB-8]|uniref:Uncharacterized protein n=1 Tax=Paraflavisolibacter caeni TaxID=2982496 RepID=A0A9X2XPT4_9BACT|nr:hypothetical protein [Paraflavisolibacter caeni]MCU7551744.1 hypothetical protein [Paraflavisolibacter caeni]